MMMMEEEEKKQSWERERRELESLPTPHLNRSYSVHTVLPCKKSTTLMSALCCCCCCLPREYSRNIEMHCNRTML